MGLEIERKFLVDADPGAWPPSVRASRAWLLRQGYVTPPGSDPEVRVRHARPVDPRTAPHGDGDAGDAGEDEGETRQLTTKAATAAAPDGAVTRVEVEVDVDEAAFDELWGLTAGRRVEKVRIEFRTDDAAGRGTVFTVDHFRGDLRGLILAEVEFEDAAAARAFRPPAFLLTEVTDDRRYRNAELATLAAPPADPAAPPGDAAPPAPDGPTRFSAPHAGQGDSMGFQIGTDETLGDGLRRSAGDQLDGAVRALEERFEADPAKAIHDARKRIKKTRALLRLARPAVGRKVARRDNATLRTAAATLSAARDADVLVQTVDDLAERYVGRLPSATFEAVRHEFSGSGAPRPAPSVAEALDGIREVRAHVDTWPLDAAGRDELLAGEGIAYAAGRAQLPGPGDAPSAEELHEWRKRVKDLWYHGLLLRNAWAPVVESQAEEAHHLSEILGDDHDLFVLHERLVAGPVADPTADVDGLLELIDRRRAELLGEALVLGRRVYAESPKAHAKRLRRLVDVWQEDAAA
ncbi:CHAD domain-containing protein [Patulibacter sp.]|uniref:CYTH and CHAD domain-containing protein n=1 Tax=Patulibacter sp. TaxID=1912859 RepID=UPI00271FDCF2|nr:CHAD domain-containing protein [Patulibacter sp.]MDO9408162.1 CHAD domain-containing protein [Patulibacter sp.]